jgi:hypothetical protein
MGQEYEIELKKSKKLKEFLNNVNVLFQKRFLKILPLVRSTEFFDLDEFKKYLKNISSGYKKFLKLF